MGKRTPPPKQGLKALRPVLDRLILIFALLGVLTTVHLIIQQNRGFDQGCLGFQTSEGLESTFDCSIVTDSDAAKVFGISNAYWGFSFYVLIALLSVAVLLVSQKRRHTLKRIRALCIVVGFAFTLYLVYYQFYDIEVLCALCLISATIETALFATLLIDFFSRPPRTITQKKEKKSGYQVKELVFIGTVIALVIALAGFDVIYFKNLEVASTSAPANEGSPPTSSTEQAGNLEGCVYDPNLNPVENWAYMVTVLDLQRGNAESAVTVFDFFDTNCPHCQTLHFILEHLIAEHEEDVLFVYKPYVIYQQSVLQTAALFAAGQEGKFNEMLHLQMINQNSRAGIQAEQLRDFASQIGIDADVMMERVESGIYLQRLQRIRATGDGLGITSVPKVMINGRFVASSGRTRACLDHLIEEAKRGD